MIASEKVLVVDIDGTLCPIKQEHQSYADLPVEAGMHAALVNWHAEGGYIILATARGMRSNEGNTGTITATVLPTLVAWLAANEIPYDELHIGKPWAGRDGFYIDDRAVRPREFLENDHAALNALCKRDRIAR